MSVSMEYCCFSINSRKILNSDFVFLIDIYTLASVYRQVCCVTPTMTLHARLVAVRQRGIATSVCVPMDRNSKMGHVQVSSRLISFFGIAKKFMYLFLQQFGCVMPYFFYEANCCNGTHILFSIFLLDLVIYIALIYI